MMVAQGQNGGGTNPIHQWKSISVNKTEPDCGWWKCALLTYTKFNQKSWSN